jgi:uncharacterized coiled-coil protein SlyX
MIPLVVVMLNNTSTLAWLPITLKVRGHFHISTLECDVAESEQVIDAIRTELGPTRSENAALQQEIKALKKALIGSAGRASSPALPPPSPFPSPHHPPQLGTPRLRLRRCSRPMYI